MDLAIDQILVGRFGVFCYLVTEPTTREAMLVDPGAEPARILDRVRERDARVRWIVCTHAHPDHVGAVARVKADTGASVVIHSKEAKSLGSLHQRVLVRLMGGKPVPLRCAGPAHARAFPWGDLPVGRGSSILRRYAFCG